MKHKAAAALLLGLILTAATACNDDDGPRPVPTNTVYNLVTLAGRSADGLTFAYQSNYDAPTYTYVASGAKLDEKTFPTGCRLLIGYVPENGDVEASGAVTLWKASPIFNGKLQYGAEADYRAWADNEIQVVSMWMTDGWLNINGKFPTKGSPADFRLVCDKATDEEPVAHLYMVFTPRDADAVPVQTYAAFDIASLQGRPGLEKIIVHAANLTGPDEFTYTLRQQITPQ